MTGPAPGRPPATYRLQLRPEFGFDDAAAVAALPARPRRLARLPVAGPAGGARLDARLRRRRPPPAQRRARRRGRRSDRLSDAAARARARASSSTSCPTTWRCRRRPRSTPRCGRCCGTGPPRRTRAGSTSTGRRRSGPLLMPVLGRRIGEVRGRRRDHARPRRGTATGAALLRPRVPGAARHRGPAAARSCWTGSATGSAHWRVGDEELNYRRFFDVDTLVGVRVEDARGLRRDPRRAARAGRRGPDRRAADRPPRRAGRPARLPAPAGRARPAARGSWSRRSSRATSSCPPTGRAPARPATTPCCASAGCSSTPAGAAPLTALLHRADRRARRLRPRSSRRPSGRSSSTACRPRWTGWSRSPPPSATTHLELRDHTRRGLREALVELLVAFPVYRAYVVPGEPAPGRAPRDRSRGRRRRPASGWPRTGTARSTCSCALALGDRRPRPAPGRVRRPVPADLRPGDGQGRRGHRVLPLAPADRAERGRRRPGAPRRRRSRSSTRGAPRQLATWPDAMTTLSTHDTKRREDVRARLCAARPSCRSEWGRAVTGWRARDAPHRGRPVLDANTEYLLWQTLVGAWPIDADRLDRLPREGDPRGQAAHDLDRAGRGVRRRGAPASPQRCSPTPSVAGAVAGVRRPARAGLAGQRARRRSCVAAHHARRARTSTRAASSSTCRWSTPTTAARSTTPTGAARLARLDAGERPRRPGRREAAGRLPGAAAAPRAPRVVRGRLGLPARPGRDSRHAVALQPVRPGGGRDARRLSTGLARRRRRDGGAAAGLLARRAERLGVRREGDARRRCWARCRWPCWSGQD